MENIILDGNKVSLEEITKKKEEYQKVGTHKIVEVKSNEFKTLQKLKD